MTTAKTTKVVEKSNTLSARTVKTVPVFLRTKKMKENAWEFLMLVATMTQIVTVFINVPLIVAYVEMALLLMITTNVFR